MDDYYEEQIELEEDQFQSATEDYSEYSEISNDDSQKYSDCEDSYCLQMKELLIDYCTMLDDPKLAENYFYLKSRQSELSCSGYDGSKRTLRVAKELATLEQGLPLSDNGVGIFVRVDEKALHCIKVIVTGPDDTPYAFGCFEFDIFLPSHYPSTPPFVTFRTTANGTVRFNPNLYQCGKVCLSLLGTWTCQHQCEKWQPGKSTLIQVLISLQSLVLVDRPYFNEPGYGAPTNSSASKEYNKKIRKLTLQHAIIDMIISPPAVFEDVILKHFRLNKFKILETVQSWREIDCSLAPLAERVVRLLNENFRDSDQ